MTSSSSGTTEGQVGNGFNKSTVYLPMSPADKPVMLQEGSG